MRVKRLELQGFKSFKEKTVIRFDHTITGIVGPNGCGKSNIVDAFFWVMGEQSYKHIRGTSSADLIFNGSTKYPSAGVAEATLVLETDYVDTGNAPSGATYKDVPLHLRSREVAVTRRVFRDGEGEYFLNGVPCRLKDIKEFFMDTGVGAKGYSVIEQGQIGRIVNSKPEERRLLIEEAAGIAKYKARKLETYRKLEATDANLSRLKDIIQEIERNLSSLDRQAQKARKYKEYRQELLEKEMTWGRRRHAFLKRKLDVVRTEKDEIDVQIQTLRSDLQKAENELEVDRVAQLTSTKNAEAFQARIQEYSDLLTREQSALELSRRRQEDLSRQLDSMKAESENLRVSIDEETQKLKSIGDQSGSAESEFEKINARVREIENAVNTIVADAESKKSHLSDSERALVAYARESNELISKKAGLNARLENYGEQMEHLVAEETEWSEKVSAHQAAVEQVRASQVQALERETQLRTEFESATTAIAQTETEIDRSRAELDQFRQSFTELKSRLESLEELDRLHEGLANGPKALLDWSVTAGKKEKFQLLADLYSVSEGYEESLEGWLESRLDQLVVEDLPTALEGLHHIESEEQGRAAIHLANSTGSRRALPQTDQVRQLLADQGFTVLGLLEDFAKPQTDLARSFVRNVFVVQDIQPLLEKPELIAHLSSFLAGFLDCGVVTRSGMVLDADGTIRGGSTVSSHPTSLLGRKRAIQNLRSEAEVQASKEQELRARVESSEQNLKSLKARLELTRKELKDAEIRSNSIKKDEEQALRAFQESEKQLSGSRQEKSGFERQIAELAAEIRKTADLMAEIQQKSSGVEHSLRSEKVELSEKETEIRNHQERLQQLRVEEAGLRERSQSVKRELDAARRLIEDRELRLKNLEELNVRVAQERSQHEGGDQSLQSKIEDLVKKVDSEKSALTAVKDQMEQILVRVESNSSRTKALHKDLDQKQTRQSESALELERMSAELDHLIQNLEEKYGPGCLETTRTPHQEEMSDPVVTEQMTEEEERLLGEEIERLRERIRRLGDVNTVAIEEYDELKKRHDHLVSEQQDLLQSVENLKTAIEHINRTSEERFAKAFEAIAKRFEKLFPIVFGGGKAELSLVYPEGSSAILDAGVDILAQPPGKKIVNIGVLSGGEKALTAVALIFAIFMVKPSPFCILDEVDAPLDDMNIGKFNTLLKEMSAKTQFILITHNKKTMEMNDTLYGVTMEEEGVSKMISIEMGA